MDFGFAFDDKDFSDRILRIELISEDRLSDSNRKRKCLNTVVKVITLNVCSTILAANSPFFLKLFKNGMKESQEKEVTMTIHASEEAPLMDLLKFIYKNTLSATTASDLLNVLMAADKYEVTSCMAYCTNLLKEMPLSLESTLSYLELPSCEAVQPLKDAAKKYLVETFKDFTKSQEKAMELPLFALEVVLGIDDLKVCTEGKLFDFIVRWGRAHYHKVQERRKILTKRLAPFLHFPSMSSHKLEEALASSDFVQTQLSKLVFKALHLNAGIPRGREITNQGVIRNRVYERPPVKVVHVVESPSPRCLVHFNLRKDDVKSLYPSKSLYSQAFTLGKRWFYLSVQCNNEHHQFGLYVCMASGCESCTVDYGFAVLTKKNLREYQSKFKVRNQKLETVGLGCRNLFGISWTDFTSDQSEYFVHDVLHLRAELTINDLQA